MIPTGRQDENVTAFDPQLHPRGQAGKFTKKPTTPLPARADQLRSQTLPSTVCQDDWDRWNQGQCGTYATALIAMNPSLRLGLAGDMEDDEFFSWRHAFAHDDHFAYDAGGKHPLPYHGVSGQFTHVELDQRLEDYDFAYDEAGPEGEEANIQEAIAHAERNAILEGR